jgi:hypothetical protein
LNQPFPYHFLKLDAQGAEYEILRAPKNSFGKVASECISNCLPFLYKLLSEVEAYLAGFEFDLVKKFPPHGSFDSQNDFLFMKRSISNKISQDVILKVYDD